MRRREFITLLGGATAAWPLAARAQQPERMRRIGVLTGLAANDPEGQARVAAFLQGLEESGWSVGRNVRIDIRWSAGNADDSRKYAAELVALAPDIILASSTPAVAALLQATRTIPIVFTVVADPVGAGFVDSLARPGGNATGFISLEYGLAAKWLELLKEIAPGTTRAAVLRDPAITAGIGQFAAIQTAAPPLGMEILPGNVPHPRRIQRGVAAFRPCPHGGGHFPGQPFVALPPRFDHHAAAPPQTARSLQQWLLRRRWRPDGLWARSGRSTPARGPLCRPHPQGRKTGRPGSADADQVRAGDQSKDRQRARPRSAGDVARPRRRGDRIALFVAAVHESAFGRSGLSAISS